VHWETAVPAPLNRFPLALWAREAARRLGYKSPDAEALGHAYGVLYAIRANKRQKVDKDDTKQRQRSGDEQLHFAGDKLNVAYDEVGRLQGPVGGDRPQTPRTYRAGVAGKFPADYAKRLGAAFRKVLKAHPPEELDGRLEYDLYDEWKEACAAGRGVNLDKLLDWCERRAAAKKPRPFAAATAAGAGTGQVRVSATASRPFRSGGRKPRSRRRQVIPAGMVGVIKAIDTIRWCEAALACIIAPRSVLKSMSRHLPGAEPSVSTPQERAHGP
jgi:hypothetical protein